jgi:hypothetical protein
MYLLPFFQVDVEISFKTIELQKAENLDQSASRSHTIFFFAHLISLPKIESLEFFYLFIINFLCKYIISH